MNQKENYLKSFLSFSIGTWINALLSFISTPIITFLIAPNEFGKANMYLLVYNLLLITSFLGLEQAFVRFFYEFENKSALLWNCIWPSVFFLFAISAVIIFFNSFLSVLLLGSYDKWIGLLIVFSLFFGYIRNFVFHLIRMKKKGFLYSLLQVLTNVFLLIGTVFYAMLLSKTYYAIVIGQIVSNASIAIIGVAAAREYFKPEKLDKKIIKKLLTYSLPYVPTFLLAWLYQSIDRITLRALTGFEEVGFYSVAFKIASVVGIIQTSFTNFWTPVAYERYNTSSNDLSFYRKVNQIVSFVMFSIGSLIVLFKDVIFLLVSREYRAGSAVTPFLVLGPIMHTISETTVLGINFSKKTYWHFFIALITSITNLIGNVILVPVYGAKGAAISTGLSYVLLFSLRTVISQKLYSFNFDLKKIYTITSLLVIQCFLATFYDNYILNIISASTVLICTIVLYNHEFQFVLKAITEFIERKFEKAK